MCVIHVTMKQVVDVCYFPHSFYEENINISISLVDFKSVFFIINFSESLQESRQHRGKIYSITIVYHFCKFVIPPDCIPAIKDHKILFHVFV